MTTNEKGRHCMACQKTVVDFTMMSDREILDYISKSSSNICGRVGNDQLHRPIPISAQVLNASRTSFWKFLLPAVLFTGGEGFKPKKIKFDPIKFSLDDYKVSIKTEDTRWDTSVQVTMMGMMETTLVEPIEIIRGQVFDSATNKPLDGVKIKIAGTKTNTTSSDGEFQLEDFIDKKKIELELTAIGYKRNIWSLKKNGDWTNLRILMTPEPNQVTPDTSASLNLQVGTLADKLENIINNHPLPANINTDIEERVYVGGISSSYTISKTEKIIRSLVDTLTSPAFRSVKVFPNPVIGGNTINLELSLKETGDYKLEIIDMSGRVVLVQPLLVTENKQISQVPTNTTWSKGIYWLRITGQHTKNVYQSKLLLQ
jgi:hypothetical protein